MRVLIVGSGLAGLECALTAHELGHDVTILTKGQLADSATAWAQGGVAVALGPDDSPALHAADTMRASANLAVPSAVDVLVSDGPDIVRELTERGAHFDRASDGELARGREAAHSVARVIHAGGDATGREIERALIAAIRSTTVTVVEHTALLDLILHDGRVTGVTTLSDAGEAGRWSADAVVLATGGAGMLYPFTTNPAVATGDGLAAALRAGAATSDLEFVQFHPTALAGAAGALISEAVRGDGAVLRNAAGERFMLTVHPDAELAPRDVVARAVARQMAADRAPAWLDATALRPAPDNAAYLAERFPTIDRLCRANGIDWSRAWVPVTPAAHYIMGGVDTDSDGRTTLPGLWAVGEVARTGVHGANRLASNSLLEAAVFARRAARSLDIPAPSGRSLRGTHHTPEPAGARTWRREDLQNIMWHAAGLERSEDGLREADAQIAHWAEQTFTPSTVHELEDRNLLDVARAVVRAALGRRESVGAHYRVDDEAARTDANRRPEAHHV
ncbi:MAG TPA: L-aspartate oxidase [Microbacteriaceae bacterium]|nr:L-aspartate oxidase [Microbacteriaceae bacterium]